MLLRIEAFCEAFVSLERHRKIPPTPPLNRGLVEVDFDGQWPGFLNFLRPLGADSNHGTQVVWVDFVHVLQELFVSVDAQLEKRRKEVNKAP